MARRATPRPTDAELAILRVLWVRGSSTVREVQEELAKVRPTGYTTVLKLLQIMGAKQLVRRDEKERAHRYEARVAQGETQGKLVDDLLERAFGGSAKDLVLRALSERRSTPEELAQIRGWIDHLERDAAKAERPGPAPKQADGSGKKDGR
jgi:BlaI family transcriptional regulator, penicillinase repressor